MKNYSKRIGSSLIALLICFVFISNVEGQCSSSASDISHGPSGVNGLKECSNDVWQDECYYLKVFVNSYGLSFYYTDCSENTGGEDKLFTGVSVTSPYHSMRSPDVSIVKDANDVFYAVCVYYNPVDKYYYMEPFKFEPVGLTSIYQATSQGANKLHFYTDYAEPYNIHIDANTEGDFAIVFENGDEGYLQTVVGRTPTTGPFGQFTYGIDLDTYTTANYSEPDVAITEVTSGTPNIYYTFTNKDGRVYVKEIDKASIISSAPSAVTLNDIANRRVPNTHLIMRPRIACSNSTGTTSDQWTAVWEDRNTVSGFSDVEGISDDGSGSGISPGTGTTDYWYYANGSQDPTDLRDLAANGKQRWPVVAYDNTGSGIQIAWYSESLQSLSITLPTASVIGLSGDLTGALASNSCIPSNLCYEIASNNPKATQVYPSLAGRHASRMIVAFFDADYETISEKNFELCRNFRQSNSALTHPKKPALPTDHNIVKPNLLIFPNPSGSVVQFKFETTDAEKIYNLSITDLLGRQQKILSGNVVTLNRIADVEIPKLPRGIYILTIADNKNIILTRKICRQ